MRILEFARILGKLKKIKRTGWVLLGVKNPESVADHIFRVSVLTLFLAPKNIDRDKAVKIALIHDLAEAKIGDVIKYSNNETLPGLKEKLSKERNAMQKLLSSISAEEFLPLYDEYAANRTPEARFVKQIDKLERAIQAVEYEKESGINADDFVNSAKKIIENEELKDILIDLENQRTKK
jgi:putative hydrolases of HD superfamily